MEKSHLIWRIFKRLKKYKSNWKSSRLLYYLYRK